MYMTEHEELKLKVAMPDVLGMFLVSYFAAMVGLVLLDAGVAPNDVNMILAISPWLALAFGVVTVFSYLNENMFASALFGFLTAFLFAFPKVVTMSSGVEDIALFVLFAAVLLFVLGFVSIAQPVKMVTGLILLAAITFLVVGVWIWDGMASSTYETIGGVFGILTALLGLYVPSAILFNTMKGDNVLPLM